MFKINFVGTIKMKHIKNMWRCNILFLLILGPCCHALAQNVAFIASPSAAKMGIKDQIQVTFTIRNVDNLVELRPTNFGDFIHVDGPFQSQSMSFSNGARSSSVTLTYVLQPKHEGKLTIPPAVARDAAGHAYQSNAMVIEVVAGSLAPPQQRRPARNSPFGDDDDPFLAMQQQMQRLQQLQQQQMQRMQQMQGGARPAQPQQQQAQPQNEPQINDAELKKELFIRVAVDKSKVHVGEQITTSYKLYSRVPMQVSISKLPSLNGFWTQDFEIPKQPKPTEEIIDGQKYQVFLLKKSALFPQQTGTLELDPAEAKGAARIIQNVRRKVADMFGNGTLMMNDPFFNNAYYNAVAYKDVNVHLQSTPVKITVTPLPEKGKPADYGGAVGNFTIGAKIDKQELTTDDVATLTLNITGSGNLKLIEAPKLKLPNGINTYDPQITDTVTGRSTTISGTKTIAYAVTPQTAGDYDIPAVAFSYFNPQSGTYTTLHTQPMKLHVKPGKHYNPAHVAENAIALKDIHEIAAKPIKKFYIGSKPLMQTPGYWSMYALPVLAFLGLIAWRRRSEELSRDSVLLRSKRANKVALQRLVTAKKLLAQNDRKPFHEEISKAIWLYLSDKLAIPLSSLSRETATAALTERRVPEAVQKRFETVIWECETALYATGGSKKMSDTYESAVQVISDLEGLI